MTQPNPDSRLGHLLLRAARRWNEVALDRVHRQTGYAMRPAHTALFPFIPFFGGIRATVLAQHIGISKQAVGKLLRDLESAGVLERSADPSDGRAVLFGYTDMGRTAIQQGLEVFDAMAVEMADEVGPERLAAFGDTLRAVTQWLDATTNGSP